MGLEYFIQYLLGNIIPVGILGGEQARFLGILMGRARGRDGLGSRHNSQSYTKFYPAYGLSSS